MLRPSLVGAALFLGGCSHLSDALQAHTPARGAALAIAVGLFIGLAL